MWWCTRAIKNKISEDKVGRSEGWVYGVVRGEVGFVGMLLEWFFRGGWGDDGGF